MNELRDKVMLKQEISQVNEELKLKGKDKLTKGGS